MKTKHNRTLRAASVLLILVFITTCAFSGTLAKYTQAAEAASQRVRVAAWNIEINLESSDEDDDGWVNLAEVNADDLALLSQTKLTHSEDNDQEDDGATDWAIDETSLTPNDAYGFEDSVTDGTMVIAPGMGGYKNIYLRNNSEVPALVTIDTGSATVNDKLDRVKLAIADEEITDLNDVTWNGDLATGIPAGSGGDVILPADGTVITVGIAWKWDFGASDKPYTADENLSATDYDHATDADTVLGLVAANVTDGYTGDGVIVAGLQGAKIVVSQID